MTDSELLNAAISAQKTFEFSNEDGKIGLVSKSGKVIVSPKFTEPIRNGNCLYIEGKKKNTFYDLSDEEGKVLEVSTENYPIVNEFFSDGLLGVGTNINNHGFINLEGKLVIPCVYMKAHAFSEGLAAVKENDLWGYIDTEGKIVIPFKYSDAEDFNNGLAIVRETDKLSVIDKQGNEVIAAKYDWIMNDVRDSMPYFYFPKGKKLTNSFRVSGRDGYGLIDYQGNELLPVEYNQIYYSLVNYYSTRMVVDANTMTFLIIEKKNDKFGACSHDGKIYVPSEYDDIHDFSSQHLSIRDTIKSNSFVNCPSRSLENTAFAPEFQNFNAWFVKKEGLWGVIVDSKEYIPCKYEAIAYMGGTIFAFLQGGMYGIIKDGIEVTPAIYNSISGFFDGLAAVSREGCYGYIDLNAKEVLAPIYEDAYNFENGYAIVRKDGKEGIIDINGEFICPCQYERIYPSDYSFYSLNLGLYRAKLSENSKCVIDVHGNVVIDEGTSFERYYNLIVKQSNDGLKGLFNAKGEVIVPCEYEDIAKGCDSIIIKKNGLYGLLTVEGERILPTEYDYISEVDDNGLMVIAKQGRKWLAFDKTGKPMIAPKAKKK